MKMTQFLIDKIVCPLIDKIVCPLMVALLTPIIIGIASKVSTGDWIKWFSLIPRAARIIFGLVIFLWVIVIAIRSRVKQLQNLDAGPAIFVISTPIFGLVTIGKLNYAGLVWVIRAPAPALWKSFTPSEISPSSIEVETPPRCPKCGTEIEESHSFWGGYIWRCVRCDFKKRNRNNYYREEERAEKVARREWEEQKHKK
jgi:ribosomal protein L37AE/L43A